MTRDQASKIANALEGMFPYTRTVTTDGNHSIQIDAYEMGGTEMLALVSILAPGGAPVPGLKAKLVTGRGITID